jgi:NADH dehydrogenase/NADH:ubiquinone oxidoreductase subunit G
MLSCEDAYLLGRLALAADPQAVLALGPVPVQGKDKTFPPGSADGYTVYAEKAPNARGVKRVLSALAASANVQLIDAPKFAQMLKAGQLGAAIITGNYTSEWATTELLDAARQPAGGGGGGGAKPIIIVLDTLASALIDAADVVLPSSTWLEKAGTFENAKGILQAFEAAIPPLEASKPEGQIALDLMAILAGAPALVEAETMVINPAKAGQVPGATRILTAVGRSFNAADIRIEMARQPRLEMFATSVAAAPPPVQQQPDMQMVEL